MKIRSAIVLGCAGILFATTGALVMRQYDRGHASLPAAATEYACPMHPFIVKDQPGPCVICGMDLVRKGSADLDPRDLALKEHVYLSPAQQVMANVAVMNVMYKPLFKVINAVGVISYDQTRQGRASAGVDGRIDRLAADAVGRSVNKDQPIAELGSTELASAEEEYLVLFRGAGPQDRAVVGRDTRSLLYRAHQRLRQLGFQDAQFHALERSRQPNVRIPVYSPLSGVVIAKNVQEGQFVKAGETLVSVADLSQVWAELDVYEDEFPFLRTGQTVVLESRSYPGMTFPGSITFIAPVLEPRTRTVRVRVQLSNQQLLLKPDMLVEALVQVPLGTDLAVPLQSVVVTGSRSLVWVQTKPGLFVPREVKTGVRYRYDIQVLEGLKKDEVVAANGAYLIDAEAQLETGEHAGLKSSAATTAARSRDDLDMSDMTMDTPSSGATTSRTLRQH
jgi:membrane fusion protein, copper/silver efflux system